jgi:hypothetical protein
MAKPRGPKKTNGDSPVAAAEPSSVVLDTMSSEPAASASKKAARKPSIVKSDARPNLFPINLDDEIRRLAYLMAERRGFEPGHETEDWLAAEREVLQRYHQHSA